MDYNKVLCDISVGEPVSLTKNIRGRYTIVDITEDEKTKAYITEEFCNGQVVAKTVSKILKDILILR